MINLLSGLTYVITSLDATMAQSTEEFSKSGTIGLVVLAIIVTPVIILTSISILSTPRNYRISGLFLGALFLFTLALIAFFAVGGALLRFVVPQ